MTKPQQDNPTAEFKLTFDEGEVTVILEFHFSDNAEEFIDVPTFVNVASTQLLNSMAG